MTRKEAKELLPFIQAFVEGKTIEFKSVIDGSWIEASCPSFIGGYKYRIKLEPKYRPFKTKEECWNEMLKHQPFGWVKDTSNRAFYSILEVINDGCVFAYGPVVPFDDIYKYYTFADGTPFGIKEE